MSNEFVSNIAEAKQRKRVVEQQIADLLKTFMQDTGLRVESVNLEMDHTVDGRVLLHAVCIEVQL